MSNKPRGGDFTGRQRDALAKANAAELLERQKEIAIAVQAEEEVKAATVVDYAPAVEVVVNDEVVVEKREVEIRVNEDLPMVTFGVGNHYDFEKGRKYKVSPELAAHLEELGYVWH